MPLGEEWNAATVVKNTTAPAVKTRAGRFIEPITLPKKRPAPAAEKGAADKKKKTTKT
jgi:hypothetical protein